MKDPERLLASDATPWEARLLRAACTEEPSPGARAALQRELGLESATAPAAQAAVPRAAQGVARKLVSKWLVLATTGAALLGSVPWLLRATSATKPPARATPSSSAASAYDAHEASAGATQPAAERRSSESAPEVESEPPHTPVAAEPSAARSLAQELAGLERVRAELQRGLPARALTQLSAHERRYPRGTLREEALALRSEALLAAGERTEAARVARVFLHRYPRSVHAIRIRAQLEQAIDAR